MLTIDMRRVISRILTGFGFFIILIAGPVISFENYRLHSALKNGEVVQGEVLYYSRGFSYRNRIRIRIRPDAGVKYVHPTRGEMIEEISVSRKFRDENPIRSIVNIHVTDGWFGKSAIDGKFLNGWVENAFAWILSLVLLFYLKGFRSSRQWWRSPSSVPHTFEVIEKSRKSK